MEEVVMTEEKTSTIMDLIEKGQIEKVFLEPDTLFEATQIPTLEKTPHAKSHQLQKAIQWERFKTAIMLLFSCLLLGKKAISQCIQRLKIINQIKKYLS